MSAAPHTLLARALELSRDILSAAENADAGALTALDDVRAQLIKSFRLDVERGGAGRPSMGAADRDALAEIVALNDRALGLMEHHRRGKGRQLDMAAVGRRAVAAYGHMRQHP
jgi:hypothetical protein